MGLNRVCNLSKVRKVEALLRQDVARVVARKFQDQNEWLVITTSGLNFVVNLKKGTSEPYDENGRVYVALDHGIQLSPVT